MNIQTKPLIYSCSGCSSAAQMANYIAVTADRSGDAEMSCIVGVGGKVKKLVKTALSNRKIVVLDGCPLSCAKACLANHGIEPAVHIELSGLGVKKIQHGDFDPEQAQQILASVRETLQKM
ncbi:putative zinc-binding protein [Agriterribacter sp.]|uniref:putative zinc-binding protein n=1 Tax=Agriterribacter sp. TaxID=2821509 RepID=UPI002B8B114B|nr:putative zinc-binding protein [Agriterribacter sp.]HRP55813.1 putative zinc-binding protein [Agriterribacter sp.]